MSRLYSLYSWPLHQDSPGESPWSQCKLSSLGHTDSSQCTDPRAGEHPVPHNLGTQTVSEQSWIHNSSPRYPWAQLASLGLPETEGEMRWLRPLGGWGNGQWQTRSKPEQCPCDFPAFPGSSCWTTSLGLQKDMLVPKVSYPRKFLLSQTVFSPGLPIHCPSPSPPPLLLPARLWTCPASAALPVHLLRGKMWTFTTSPGHQETDLPATCLQMHEDSGGHGCCRAGRPWCRYGRPWPPQLWQIIVSQGWGRDKFSCSWVRQTAHMKSSFRALKKKERMILKVWSRLLPSAKHRWSWVLSQRGKHQRKESSSLTHGFILLLIWVAVACLDPVYEPLEQTTTALKQPWEESGELWCWGATHYSSWR